MRPLLSACLIVRDEQENLPRCLASLAGLVDEIVVHDTGSVDDTVAIARAAGAKVILGEWHADFARARNTSLDACTGEWVIGLDADEEIVCDPAVIRLGLQRMPAEANALSVAVENLGDDGEVSMTHTSLRLFRAGEAHWSGALHEQLVSISGAPLRSGLLRALTVRHHGYVTEAMEGKDKLNRNLALAEAAVEASCDIDAAKTRFDLARTLLGLGRHEDALGHFDEARRTPSTPGIKALVLRGGTETLLSLGRADDAMTWLAELHDAGLRSESSKLLESTALLMLGRAAEAVAVLEEVTEVWDATGINVPEHSVRQARGFARLSAGDHHGAATELIGLVRERPSAPLWGPLAEASLGSNGGVAAAEVAAAVPEEHLRAVLAQLLLVDVEASEHLGQALWDEHEGDPRLAAFAVKHAPRLDAGRALTWSSRVRAAGLDEHCPLLTRAMDPQVPALDRLLAGSVAHGAFDDPLAQLAVLGAAESVRADELMDALSLLGEVAPRLLPDFVMAVAADPQRAPALADALEELGASEQAELVRSA